MTANADGSNVQTLLNDGVPKADPHWSPAGDRIVYWTPGGATEDPRSPVNVVMITAGGRAMRTIHVSEKDWVLFRGVQIGWYGNDAVFAAGMVNTVVFDTD